MADKTISEKFNEYLKSVVSTMIADDSLRDKQHKKLVELFDSFGLTSEQISQVMAQTLVAETQYINQFGTMGASKILEEERAGDLTTKQIEKLDKEIELIGKQIIRETNQANLILAQKALIERQEDGYDDNLIVKSAEFEGGLASFAVNANSDTAQAAIDKFVATIAQLKLRAT